MKSEVYLTNTPILEKPKKKTNQKKNHTEAQFTSFAAILLVSARCLSIGRGAKAAPLLDKLLWLAKAQSVWMGTLPEQSAAATVMSLQIRHIAHWNHMS